MTALGDAIEALINAQWSGAGGTKPTRYVSDDNSTRPSDKDDYVWISSYTIQKEIKFLNRTYADVVTTIEVEVNTGDIESATKREDRLKELADEVERIINTNTLTGYQVNKVIKRENISNKRMPYFREKLTIELQEYMKSW